MNVKRVQGAPRLIEWTGERCVPWIDDPPVIYEHYHRYLFAAAVVAGRRVLDLASGEGFGAALLAEQAESVLGIDVDEPSVEHARANYAADGLEFQVGDALALERLEAGAFDAVVAFEMLEHLADQDRVLAGIRHVLAPDGILIVSTPERTAYSEEREFTNPYHARELTLAEFRELLGRDFAHVQTWGQRTVTGSVLSALPDATEPLEAPAGQGFAIEWTGDRWEVGAEIAPMYVIALASDGPLPDGAGISVLADPGQSLLRHAEAARDRARELQRGAERRAEEVVRDHERMRRELLGVGDELADERRRGAELELRTAQAEGIIARLHDELALAQAYRAGVESSQVWRLFQAARRRGYGVLGGRESRPGRLLERTIRLIAKRLLRVVR